MAAPTIRFDQLPANENPYKILQDQFAQSGKSMMRDFEGKRHQLQTQRMSDKDFNNQSSRLESGFQSGQDELRSKRVQAESQLNSLKQMIDSGRISPDAGYEAMMRMVVPAETAAAMFQGKGKPDKPLGVGTLMGKSLATSIGSYAGAATDLKGFEWGDPRKSKDSLVEYYGLWRQQLGYDQLNPLQQNQLDMQWDQYMRGNEAFKHWWNKGDKKKRNPITEVRAMRAKGGLAKRMASRITGTPSVTKGTSSPVGKAATVKHKTREMTPGFGFGVAPVSETEQETEQPTAEELRGLKTKEAYEKGKKLGYWE